MFTVFDQKTGKELGAVTINPVSFSTAWRTAKANWPKHSIFIKETK